ncbi:MAG TPA: DUF4382 domain-containing protein [Sunxiuqinia sp.]|nr:DUF4382 domain-containing protein [Sunxiuqinia sp.]
MSITDIPTNAEKSAVKITQKPEINQFKKQRQNVMKFKNSILFAMVALALTMVQCKKDNGPAQQGQINVKMTDAPSDDANIKGTFVTVTDVKVDGKSVEGFTAQTIEVSAYQQGNTKLLLNKTLDAGSYNKLSMVIDYKNDASGNEPGCYVMTDDNSKHALAGATSSTAEITFNHPFQVTADGNTDMVIDFDLRKCVVRNENSSSSSKYQFVTNAEMTNAIRLVAADNCGEVNGKVSDSTSSNGELIVYAYNKGSYNESTETQGQGSSNILFANAVTSAKVANDGSYKLAFLNKGQYEIHVASYDEDSTSGKITFKGMVNASSSISGLLLNSITVDAQSQINLNIDILGIL